LVLEVLEVLVMQMLPPHKTVQILFLAQSPQRAEVVAMGADKTEEPEAREVVVGVLVHQ
jgi:hypothetical protein